MKHQNLGQPIEVMILQSFTTGVGSVKMPKIHMLEAAAVTRRQATTIGECVVRFMSKN